MEKKQTRREFLKYSEMIVLFVGNGCYFPGSGKSTDPEAPGAPGKSLSGIPPSDGYLLVDVKKCQGCVSCMLACSLVHEGVESQSLSRIQIMQNSFKAFPNDVGMSHCRQCVEPACVEACPEEALTAEARFGNVRRVDFEKCTGCGEYVSACPFSPSRSQLAEVEAYAGDDKAFKCDLCGETPYRPGEGQNHRRIRSPKYRYYHDVSFGRDLGAGRIRPHRGAGRRGAVASWTGSNGMPPLPGCTARNPGWRRRRR